MQDAPERKLVTILAADVAGYSALMGRDEAGTLARLKASRAAFAEEIARGRGRVFNTAGDGLLAEFSSVVNAVECAVRVQRRMAERNAGLPEAARMRFRIGVNLGDVLVEGEDLFGDGVNIAARLQELAEPGGILISGGVFDQVRNKLQLGFDPLGAQSVKNIAEPVAAWRVVLDAEPGGTAREPAEARAGASDRSAVQSAWSRMRGSIVLAGVLIAFFLAVNLFTWGDRSGFWFQWPSLPILLVLGLRAAWVLRR